MYVLQNPIPFNYRTTRKAIHDTNGIKWCNVLRKWRNDLINTISTHSYVRNLILNIIIKLILNKYIIKSFSFLSSTISNHKYYKRYKFICFLLAFLITNLFIIITLFVDEIAKNIESNRHQSLHDRRGHLEPRCSWRFNHIWGRIYEVKICRLSGHGTYRVDNKIHASVLGTVEITNKLIIVNPLKAKYSPQVGDIVVGRVH